MALIEALVAQGLLTRERADALLAGARAAAPSSAGAAGAAGTASGWGAAAPAREPRPGQPPVIRVPFIPETLRAQLRDEIRRDVLATAREERWADPRQLPEWLRGLALEGDVRVRFQAERFDAPRFATDPATGEPLDLPCGIVGGNLPAECYRAQLEGPAWAPDLLNTGTDRQRLTLRARLGFTARLSDGIGLGVRFSTGSTSGPTSASQTLGSGFNRSAALLDRAFLRWTPRHDWRVLGGRIGNPFVGTDLTWPDDLAFDGVAAQGEWDFGRSVVAFGAAGAFPLEEFAVDRRDKWLYGVQAGADWHFGRQSSLRVALGLYEFSNVEGVRESAPPPAGPRAGTVPYLTSQYPANLRLKGNTLINLNDPTSTAAPVWGLASAFRPLNLTAALSTPLAEALVFGATLDWVKNTGFDLADIRRRAATPAVEGLAEKTAAWQLRTTIGSPRLVQRGDWQIAAAFRRLERDAWIDGFTDTTWHLGGTNHAGWQLAGQWAFERRSTVGLRLTSTKNLDDGVRFTIGDPPATVGTLSSAPLKIDVIQIEVQTRF
jgi:hypothetical protein